MQLATLILIALIPATGLFRIDLASASFFMLGHQVWWSSFSLITGLSLIIALAPVITYKTIGTLWCGWACPQNLLSEWANNLTHKLLGKRASVEVDGEGLIVAKAKNKFLNWAVLGASFLAASIVLSLIPFLFFYTPKETWEIVTLADREKLSPFLMYLFSVFLIFIDIAAVRYFFCDYACFYRMGQRMFGTKDALHVAYDESRSSDCTKCNYCATVCITKIQPTKIAPHDICINCGECIDACNRLHQKNETNGLLEFRLEAQGSRNKTFTILKRANFSIIFLLLAGVALTAWGIATQPKPEAKIPLAVLLKEQEIAKACSAQCSKEEDVCKSRNLEGCYRAAACRCECRLEHGDPSDSGELRQCVARNLQHADAEHLAHEKASVKPAPNPP